jgi:hypothetical protein
MLFCSQLSSLHFLIVFSLVKFQCVRTFNFDLHTPILIHDAFDKEESHFGASLTLVGAKGGPGWYLTINFSFIPSLKFFGNLPVHSSDTFAL